MTFEEIAEQVLAFRDERDWKQFHNPKDLSISIVLEAAELLEIFQWSGSRTMVEEKQKELEEELADVLMYSILLADNLGLNIPDLIEKKLEQNRKKYPADLAKGRSDKYTELKKENRQDP